MPKNRNNPVAVSGMYRSGTSIFWRILSADPMFQKRFYEPLHSLLIDRIVTNPAMDDFKSNPEIMKAWSPRFNFERIHLGKNESYPELYSYLQNILVHNSLTKFTRTTMRISWLAENFPNVFIINLIRDPRAVCLSYMRRGGIEFFLSGTRSLRERFNAIRYLTNYNSKFRLLRKLWQLSIDQMPIRKLHLVPPIKQKLQGVPCRSIYCHQQYLDSLTNDLVWGDVARFAKASSPQVAILSLWKINVLQSIRDVKTLGVERGISIKFEDFVESPEKTL
ncbi:MAG: sulfotransferase, partial [Candidatus Thorarchaeota archaeon]